MVLPLLVRGLARSRRGRYVAVAVAFSIGLVAFFAVVALADGTRSAVVRPLEATLTGDVRVTQGDDDLGAGRKWSDHRPFSGALARIPGADVSPRLESTYITVRGEEFENWSAGLLVGVDPVLGYDADALRPYMVWGTPIESVDVFDPATNRAYTPLVLGRPALERLNLSLPSDGSPHFDQPLTITSGRTINSGSVPIPIVGEAVVVGVFDTGLEPLDKFTAFMPIGAVRALLGLAENDPVANAAVVYGAQRDQVASVMAAWPETKAQSSTAFAFGYMGSMLVVVYTAGALAVLLFFVALLTWLAHETRQQIKDDHAVISSLRAIGIPGAMIDSSYRLLLVASVVVGSVLAGIVTSVLALAAPPLVVHLEGVRAEIPWSVPPLAVPLAIVVLLLASVIVSWWTARRVRLLNILEGLRQV